MIWMCTISIAYLAPPPMPTLQFPSTLLYCLHPTPSSSSFTIRFTRPPILLFNSDLIQPTLKIPILDRQAFSQAMSANNPLDLEV